MRRPVKPALPILVENPVRFPLYWRSETGRARSGVLIEMEVFIIRVFAPQG